MKSWSFAVIGLSLGIAGSFAALHTPAVAGSPKPGNIFLVAAETHGIPIHASLRKDGKVLRTDDVVSGGQAMWDGLAPGAYEVVMVPGANGLRSIDQKVIVPAGGTAHVAASLMEGDGTEAINLGADVSDLEKRVTALEKKVGM